MDRTEQARLDWQKAQAELQKALAELEKAVAGIAPPEQVIRARERAALTQHLADELLNRYITHLGKPDLG